MLIHIRKGTAGHLQQPDTDPLAQQKTAAVAAIVDAAAQRPMLILLASLLISAPRVRFAASIAEAGPAPARPSTR